MCRFAEITICLWVIISQIWQIATRHGRKVRYPCVDSPKTTKAIPQNTSIVIRRANQILKNSSLRGDSTNRQSNLQLDSAIRRI
ncbi:hypothetical protein [Helicobacter sp. 23-1045]